MRLLPARLGPRPRTQRTLPHRQLDQWPAVELIHMIGERSLRLLHVRSKESRLASPETLALWLPDNIALGPREAFIDGHEFCHLHPSPEGSLHLTLRVEPALGRSFSSEETQVPGRDAVVVLGHDFWKTQLAADKSVIGRTIRLNGIDFTVVGIAPQSFTGMDQYVRPAMYVPVMMKQRLDASKDDPLEKRSAGFSRFFMARQNEGAGRTERQKLVAWSA
jgi:hypothetical protein